MKNSLFLHYGPGGNAFVENQMFDKLSDKILFWNQPKTKTLNSPYSSLVSLSTKQVLSTDEPHNIIAHSFGCSIAASIKQEPVLHDSKIILIAPLRNIPLNFLNLANILLKKQENSKLKNALSVLSENVISSSFESNLFWKLFGEIVIHPNYYPSFWSSSECMQNYLSIAAKGPVFDTEEWQAVIADYFLFDKKYNFDIFKNTNTHVLLGANDPYLSQADFDYWISLLGINNVSIIKNAGHLPHIEQPTSLLNLL